MAPGPQGGLATSLPPDSGTSHGLQGLDGQLEKEGVVCIASKEQKRQAVHPGAPFPWCCFCPTRMGRPTTLGAPPQKKAGLKGPARPGRGQR